MFCICQTRRTALRQPTRVTLTPGVLRCHLKCVSLSDQSATSVSATKDTPAMDLIAKVSATVKSEARPAT